MAKMSVPIYISIYMYIPYHIEWLYIQSWQKNRKNQKKSKKLKKIKNHRNNFWGPCQVLNMYVCMYTMILPLHFSVPIYSPWQKKKKKKKNSKNKKRRWALARARILSRTPFYQFHKEHPKNTKF